MEFFYNLVFLQMFSSDCSLVMKIPGTRRGKKAWICTGKLFGNLQQSTYPLFSCSADCQNIS